MPANDRVSHDEVLARVAALVPSLVDRAAGAEAARRIPDETMAEVEAGDLFRMMVPTRYGGHGLGLRTVSEASRIMAHGCMSSAWVIGFLIEHNWQFARFGRAVQDEVFGTAPFIRAPAQLLPAGRLAATGDGYRLSGRWPWCSGVLHSQWAILAAMTDETPPTGDRDRALVLMVPLDELEIEDDWFTSGMRATGSRTVVADDVFVPAHRVTPFRLFASEDNEGGDLHPEPVVRYPLAASLALFAASIAVGGAERVVELFREQLAHRVLYASAGDHAANRPRTQARLADATVAARSAELLWRDGLDLMCRVNDDGGRLAAEQRAWVRLSAAKAVALAKDAVSIVCDGAGASIYYDASPLQRYQRDIETLKGHVVFDVDRATVTYGQVALGLPTTDPF